MSNSVLVVFPVSWGRFTKEQKAELTVNGMVEGVPNYPRSIKMACENCGCDSWVGPYVRREKQADPTLPLWCVVCAASHGDLTVRHLGNDESHAERN